jgi:hypothetical protein
MSIIPDNETNDLKAVLYMAVEGLSHRANIQMTKIPSMTDAERKKYTQDLEDGNTSINNTINLLKRFELLEADFNVNEMQSTEKPEGA